MTSSRLRATAPTSNSLACRNPPSLWKSRRQRAPRARATLSRFLLHTTMELSQAAARALTRCRPLSLYSSPLYRAQLSPFAIRSFTTTRLLRQDQPDAFIRQLRQEEKETRSHDISATAGEDAASTPAPAQQRNETPSMVDLMDSALDGTKGVPNVSEQRTSRFATPSAQEKSRVKPMDSMEDFLTSLRPSNRSSNSLNGGYRAEIRPVKSLDFTPSPTLGKTVQVKNGGDVGRAFREVEQLCGRNRVRQDFNKQRFHERPGLKRKRLHSERWRRRFKEAFRGTVKMVNQMRKQGW
jgi:small subunit ribosomal protein MRP21